MFLHKGLCLSRFQKIIEVSVVDDHDSKRRQAFEVTWDSSWTRTSNGRDDVGDSRELEEGNFIIPKQDWRRKLERIAEQELLVIARGDLELPNLVKWLCLNRSLLLKGCCFSDHRRATSNIIGDCIKHKYASTITIYTKGLL